MKLTVKVEGADALIKKFKRFGKEGSQVVADVTKINALEIEAKAKGSSMKGSFKGSVPVDKGKLRQSIKAEKFAKHTWFINVYEKYASWIEFGTRFMPAQPFLYPAFKGQFKIYTKDLEKALDRLINKFNK